MYLHGLHIAYRDLKPETVELDASGYPRLADFACAKLMRTSRTWTLCGTPQYLAPEVVTSQGHGMAVDWWSLGVLLYEMLVGQPPFCADSEMLLYKQIMANKVGYPKGMNGTAKDLIAALLVSDPAKRLGGKGEQAVAKHAYLRVRSWAALERRAFTPPYVPSLSCDDDVSLCESTADSHDGEAGLQDAMQPGEGEQLRSSELLRKVEEAFSKL